MSLLDQSHAMNSDAHAAYVAKASRWVLIVTGVCTLPALVLLGFGMVEYQKPPNYTLDPDPELVVTIPLFLVLASAVVSFVAAFLVAVVYYVFAREKS